jgi:HPt (histidine-containing phosphotransfer) domain-containing protein
MDDSPEAMLRKAREQVLGSIDGICEQTRHAVRETPEAVMKSRDRVHRLAGVAGVVGLRQVSHRALDLEAILADAACTPERVDTAVDELKAALETDLAAVPPPWLDGSRDG